MRGGPLTEPLPQGGLTDWERYQSLEGHNKKWAQRGPSLLYREKFAAKPSEWERYRGFDPSTAAEGGNLNEDDNPFNDPFKYHPFKGMAFPPGDYIGPDDPRENDDMTTLQPANALRLKFVYGYTTRKGSRSNLFYNHAGHLVYHAAAVGVVYNKDTHEQWHFFGHDDDITALDLSPKDGTTVVSGQLGKDPKILVWSSVPESKGKSRIACLPQLCVIHGDHKRAIIGLSFNKTGEYIASMGYDNNRSIAIYKWSKDKGQGQGVPLEKMRIGVDKGHSDDVYCLAYNPVTNHIVAGGKKYLRFFGLKDGALSNPEEDARAAAKAGGSHTPALAENESKIWAKKGTFGKDLGAQDIMAIAFDSEGVTYAGSSAGAIFRFSEQATDMMVQAHPLKNTNGEPHPPLPKELEHLGKLCRVTALWFDPHKGVLISSGDDGWVHQWALPFTSPDQNPVKSFDLKDYVVKELQGTIVKMDDKELDKEAPNRGSPAAANSIFADADGNVLIGTVCNEIYEFNMADGKAPVCYIQGHYEEMWGLCMHPLKLEMCTCAEDETLRIWDLDHKNCAAIAKMKGPVRCACYSPDAAFIAVGLGGGHGPLAKHKANGKWLVLDAKDLSLKFEPPHTRFERVADIKYSPDGKWIAVGNADNGTDVYAVPGQGNSNTEYKKVAKFEGHSSFINHLDWSADSRALQTNCGAHELLYWKLYNDRVGNDGKKALGGWKPHQEKSSSSMRDEEWSTQTCIYGWHVRGLWPEGADGTDINACARNNTGDRQLIATSDDFGKVKLFRYPCIVPSADHKPYCGHSSHVTNVAFSHDDVWLCSAGGDDQAIFQWELTTET